MVQRLLAVCLLSACLGSSDSSAEPGPLAGSDRSVDFCQRPEPGSVVPEPQELRSHDGVLQVDLTIRNQRQFDGSTRYCYLTPDGKLSPTLRVKPGELLILHFANKMTDVELAGSIAGHAYVRPETPLEGPVGTSQKRRDPCTSGVMSPISTNLHFHGLTVPPECHQDDVIKTSIQPGEPPFEYRVRIPANEPPGLYWYHPQIHGFSTAQVLGGASGALIVEGIETRRSGIRRPARAGAGDPRSESLEPLRAAARVRSRSFRKYQLDRDGDAANNGTGFGKPAKDLSVNFVPVPYPDYPPASDHDEAGRTPAVARASMPRRSPISNLAVLVQARRRRCSASSPSMACRSSSTAARQLPSRGVNHIGLPPGARVEFIVEGPPARSARPAGDAQRSIPGRAAKTIRIARSRPSVAVGRCTEPQTRLPSQARAAAAGRAALAGQRRAGARAQAVFLGEASFDFSQRIRTIQSATDLLSHRRWQDADAFDPARERPNIVVKQGDVEDWIIENRSTELHDFHIHQLHFQLLDWSGLAGERAVPARYGQRPLLQRQDAADTRACGCAWISAIPNIVGTFVYHCHLLEHEDGGMMGTIRVEPADYCNFKSKAVDQSIRGEHPCISVDASRV